MFQKKKQRKANLWAMCLLKFFVAELSFYRCLVCRPSTWRRFPDLAQIYKSVKHDVTYIITICLIYRHLSSHSCNTRTKYFVFVSSLCVLDSQACFFFSTVQAHTRLATCLSRNDRFVFPLTSLLCRIIMKFLFRLFS